jgi:hypothetical protein
MDLPNLTVDLRESEEPTSTSSNIDKEPPINILPIIETVDPADIILRQLKDEPMLKMSSTENCLVVAYAEVAMDRLLDILVIARTDKELPKEANWIIEILSPQRLKLLTETADDIVTNESTETELPVRPNDRRDTMLPSDV